MAVPANSRAERPAAVVNREYILRAAAKLLRDAPGSSMSEIATAASVSRATLYRYFASRDEIIDAMRTETLGIAQGLFSDHLGPLARREPSAGSVLATIEDLVWIGLSEDSNYRQLMAGDPKRSEEVFDQFRPILVSLMHRGQESGELTTEMSADALARGMEGVISSVLRSVAAGQIAPDEGAQTFRVFVRGIRSS